jgi:hypothetical protein
LYRRRNCLATESDQETLRRSRHKWAHVQDDWKSSRFTLLPSR